MKDFVKKYARLRDEQFSMYEYYARKNGMNYKGLLILLWLYNMPQGVSQQLICQKTYSTKQVVNAVIKGYIEKGYALLENSTCGDKRKKIVKLTEEGRDYASKIIDPLDELEENAMKALTDEQRKMLLGLTELLNKKIASEIENIK